jgi:tRNA threonylcarbamoyladenosine biosynthesis protein TsaE
MQVKTIETIDELRSIASEVLASYADGDIAQIITLQGDLGAGKTAFTKELALLLGIQESITSPTFVIMKSYAIPNHPFFKTLTHIDAYRIEEDGEMLVLGFTELIKDPARLICIEWPERIKALIPQHAYPIAITLQGTTRTVTYGN